MDFDSVDLKPCPFCGSEVIGFSRTQYDGTHFGSIGCEKCKTFIDVEDCVSEEVLLEKLFKAWNTRVFDSHWIKCSERLPNFEDDGVTPMCSRVLVWYPGLREPVTALYCPVLNKEGTDWAEIGEWADDESMGPLPAHCQPTHWMPLPPIPKEDRD